MKEFDKIIGYRSVKHELEQISDTLKNREIYQKLGVCPPVGLLLHGEPGVGKTLMAKCLVAASGLKAYVCRKDKPNGDFVKSIKETFDKAVSAAPAIVFLDDMDKFANGDPRRPDCEEYVTVQSCIDEVRDKEVFVLATANSTRALPRSLLRAGRFDRVIEVDAPEGQDAVEIITHFIKNKNFADGVNPKTIARIMNGHSCAELETVINEAGLLAGFERADKITMDHFMEAYMRTVFHVSPTCADDDEDWYYAEANARSERIRYHETGHAVISELLIPESVTLVSAHNRIYSSGGFTSYYRGENTDPILWEKTRVISSLGGAAATEQKFGQSDSGATHDIDQAFDMMYDLVTNHCICGFNLHEWDYRDSEEVIASRERAATMEVERYFRKAKEILALNAEFFEKVAKALQTKLVLTTDDIQRIKAECTIVPVSI